MNQMNSKNLILSSLFILILFICCGEEPTPSLFDPNKTYNPAPVIREILPPNALAGVTEITIKGENFSTKPEENMVFFNATLAELISASSNELKVKAPKVIGDSVKIKISVHGAELFSNIVLYKLEYAAIEYGGIDHFSNAYGVACDMNENIYVSLGSSKIVKITPDQKQIDFVLSSEGFLEAMRIGPGGYLYGVRTRFLYRIPPEGGISEKYGAKFTERVYDLDFDPGGNLFVAAKKTIYGVKPDGSNIASATYTDITLNSIRVFDGYVYAAGEFSGTGTPEIKKGIWRNKILDENCTLGENELVFNWSEFAGNLGPSITAITFAENGDMYIGANTGNAITILHPNPDGNYVQGRTEPLFPAVLVPPSTVFCWGNGQYLYVNRKHTEDDFKRLIRITTGQQGAIDYGRK